MRIEPYSPERKVAWDACVRGSRNGTFLLERDYMDYHSNRFTDCSLMFLSDKNKVLAVFPADIVGKTVRSHGGLTYGGLVGGTEMTQTLTMEAFQLLAEYYRLTFHAETLQYKSIPYIYSRYPASEDAYALFRMGATLTSRGVSQAVDLSRRLAMSHLRLRQQRKCHRMGVKVEEATSMEEWFAYWDILTQVLHQCHHASPVHTREEILLLHSRFPEHIRLFLAKENTDAAPCGDIVAGTVLYVTENVVHAQYIAASERGKEIGALSFLFDFLMTHQVCRGRRYFDFGISTEQDGSILNEGLAFQKEGLGGRGVCYDAYSLILNGQG